MAAHIHIGTVASDCVYRDIYNSTHAQWDCNIDTVPSSDYVYQRDMAIHIHSGTVTLT